MKNTTIILLVIFLAVGLISCKKTYEEGPAISLRSKFSRITGKWKLVSIEGVPRLHPEVDQYMELTKDEISDGVYKANFINFQEEFCLEDTVGEKLFTATGTWNFYDGYFWNGCNIGEELSKKEGLHLIIIKNDTLTVGDKWKILELTNKTLKIVNNVCLDMCHYYLNERTLTFEKE